MNFLLGGFDHNMLKNILILYVVKLLYQPTNTVLRIFFFFFL
jgi:hypothetical protein